MGRQRVAVIGSCYVGTVAAPLASTGADVVGLEVDPTLDTPLAEAPG